MFRFTTGSLHKDAYSITTPTAAIGVRGTVLDISVQGSRTRVTVVEGRALVCPKKKGITFAQQARNCERPIPRNVIARLWERVRPRRFRAPAELPRSR